MKKTVVSWKGWTYPDDDVNMVTLISKFNKAIEQYSGEKVKSITSGSSS
jgi:hypothetical protein